MTILYYNYINWCHIILLVNMSIFNNFRDKKYFFTGSKAKFSLFIKIKNKINCKNIFIFL